MERNPCRKPITTLYFQPETYEGGGEGGYVRRMSSQNAERLQLSFTRHARHGMVLFPRSRASQLTRPESGPPETAQAACLGRSKGGPDRHYAGPQRHGPPQNQSRICLEDALRTPHRFGQFAPNQSAVPTQRSREHIAGHPAVDPDAEPHPAASTKERASP